MKKVILAPNPYRDSQFHTVLEAQRILAEVGIEARICLPFEVDRSFQLPREVTLYRMDRELPGAEMLICFGGDGTILHVSKAATRAGVPILGVNNGTMGFMAELECTELEKLRCIAADRYQLDRRMMLDCLVYRGRDIIAHELSLNDIVITKGAVARVIDLRVACDDTQVMSCNGDGVIVATPTGSTAYNLSAGGPIVEPEAKAMVITPICTHNLISHSIVISDRRTVTVTMPKTIRRTAYLSADGGRAVSMQPGDVAVIRKSHLQTALVRLSDRSFYDAVNTKFTSSR
ncbi:MAG: NAD(+)/NADH kinase [Firmicutes bacterium]|nr:NAD(+)/NADH kinase [Bacillota bacterium]